MFDTTTIATSSAFVIFKDYVILLIVFKITTIFDGSARNPLFTVLPRAAVFNVKF